MVAAIVRGVGLMSAMVGAACLLPATREHRYAQDALDATPGVARALVGCNDNYSAASDLCAAITTHDGTSLRMVGIGYRSFGATATSVRVAQAGGRVPHVVSCRGRGPAVAHADADFHRGGVFGHQLTPALLDVPEAIRRHKEIVIRLEYWPECPQFWEGEAADGLRYRYCAHAADLAPVSPPPPHGCAARSNF